MSNSLKPGRKILDPVLNYLDENAESSLFRNGKVLAKRDTYESSVAVDAVD